MVDYCKDNNIILQPVVAYNHTMQARVEGAIGCSRQHSRVTLVCANKPTLIWPDATLDFACKRNALWAKRDEQGPLLTANTCMQPAFTGSYRTVAMPFGSRVTSYLPWEHPLVKNGSFGDRFDEDTHFRADNETSCIRMYCIALGSELLVQDFKSYPDEISIPRSFMSSMMHINYSERFGDYAYRRCARRQDGGWRNSPTSSYSRPITGSTYSFNNWSNLCESRSPPQNLLLTLLISSQIQSCRHDPHMHLLVTRATDTVGDHHPW